MKSETQHPTLVIQAPNGTTIKIYQVLSTEFTREVLDEYLLEKKLLK